MKTLLRKILSFARRNGVKAMAARAVRDIASAARLSLRRNDRQSFMALREQWRLTGVQPILVMTHGLGGGTERAMHEHVERLRRDVPVIILRALPRSVQFLTRCDAVLELDHDDTVLRFAMPWRQEAEQRQWLQSFRFAFTAVHHVMDFRRDINALLQNLGAPYDVYLHDFFAACPSVHLTHASGRYCGDPHDKYCALCRDESKRTRHRAPFEILLGRAAHVYAPSQDAARRLCGFFPNAVIIPAPHETPREIWRLANRLPPLRESEALRIAVLGNLTAHKGRDLFMQTVAAAAAKKAPLRFDLIGSSTPAIETTVHAAQTGPYRDADLQKLINRINPHVIWFPALWPETYSYTLTAALDARRGIAAPDLGAFAERLADRPFSWIAAWNGTPQDFVTGFLAIRAELQRRAVP